MTGRSPEELAARSAGTIKPKHLSETGGLVMTWLYDQPPIDYLGDDEQPEYLFKHTNKGFRITRPGGREETPDHDSSEGERYLLVTDERLLYVAGYSDGDTTREFQYDDLRGVEANQALSKGRFTFECADGTRYSFVTTTAHLEVDDARDYVQRKIDERGASDAADASDSGPSSSNDAPGRALRPSEKLRAITAVGFRNARSGEMELPTLQFEWDGDIQHQISVGEHEAHHNVLVPADERPNAVVESIGNVPGLSVTDEGDMYLLVKQQPATLSEVIEATIEMLAGFYETSIDDVDRVELEDLGSGGLFSPTTTVSWTGIASAGNEEIEFPTDRAEQEVIELDDLGEFEDGEARSGSTDDGRTSGDEFAFSVERPSGLFALKPKLKILNRNTGKKVEKETLDTLTSLTKDSVIEAEGYEADLYEAEIDDDGVYVRATDPDGGEQEMRRSYRQIQAVDFNEDSLNYGITLYIEGFIYRIEIPTSLEDEAEVRQAVEHVRSRTTETQTSQPDAPESPSRDEESEIEKLRQLSDLKEEGILSEAEFEAKKRQILDRI